jgi:hypothetical protein
MARQLYSPFPPYVLSVMVCWASALFLGNGLVAATNALTVLAHLAGATAIASAIFLTLELSKPYRPSKSFRSRRPGSNRRRRPSRSRRLGRSGHPWSSPHCKHVPRSRRFDGYGRLRCHAPFASGAHEGVVQEDSWWQPSDPGGTEDPCWSLGVSDCPQRFGH